MNCPICLNELGDNDVLLVKYHAPRDWWVTCHYVPDNDKDHDHEVDLVIRDLKYRTWCMQANIQSVTDRQPSNQ